MLRVQIENRLRWRLLGRNYILNILALHLHSLLVHLEHLDFGLVSLVGDLNAPIAEDGLAWHHAVGADVEANEVLKVSRGLLQVQPLVLY